MSKGLLKIDALSLILLDLAVSPAQWHAFVDKNFIEGVYDFTSFKVEELD